MLCFSLQISLQPLFASVKVDTLTKSEKTYIIAKNFVGIKEQGNNSGYWVKRFLQSCNLKPPAQWCAAFVNFCLDSAGIKTLPMTRSGLARHFATRNKTIKATEVLQKNLSLPSGTIIVWRRGTTLFGHAGLVENWKGKSGTTIEGNTSSGQSGSQYNGDGVWRRSRTINPTNHFRITDFIVY
jgi:hypothetical protein